MARKSSLGSAVPEVKPEPFDLEAFKRAVVARANAQVPEEYRNLTPDQCRAKMRLMGGLGRLFAK